jgi:hypothetical protein
MALLFELYWQQHVSAEIPHDCGNTFVETFLMKVVLKFY